MSWKISDTIEPNFNGGLMDALYLQGGFRIVNTQSQLLSIPYLYRKLNAKEATIVYVRSEGNLYELIFNPLTDTTLLTDWKNISVGGFASVEPIGSWDSDNTDPILQDSDAFGINGKFYFVKNTPTLTAVTHAGLFNGLEVDVVDGNLIVSVGNQFVVVSNNTSWDTIDKPQVIIDYVAGTVIAHTHDIDEVSGLQDELDTKYDEDSTADHTIDFVDVPNAAIVEVEFLREFYYTKEEIDDLIIEAGGGTIIGTGVSGRVTYWTAADTIASDSGFTYNDTNNILTADRFHTSLASDPVGGVADGDFIYNSTTLDFRGRINGHWTNLTRTSSNFIDDSDSPYTLLEADRNSYIYCDTTSGNIDINLDVSLSVHFEVNIINIGTGIVTLVPGSKTLRGVADTLEYQHSAAVVIYEGSNTYYTFGGLGPEGSGGGSYTDEQAQDAIGAALVNGNGTIKSYIDAIPAITFNLGGTTTADIVWNGDSLYDFLAQEFQTVGFSTLDGDGSLSSVVLNSTSIILKVDNGFEESRITVNYDKVHLSSDYTVEINAEDLAVTTDIGGMSFYSYGINSFYGTDFNAEGTSGIELKSYGLIDIFSQHFSTSTTATSVVASNTQLTLTAETLTKYSIIQLQSENIAIGSTFGADFSVINMDYDSISFTSALMAFVGDMSWNSPQITMFADSQINLEGFDFVIDDAATGMAMSFVPGPIPATSFGLWNIAANNYRNKIEVGDTSAGYGVTISTGLPADPSPTQRMFISHEGDITIDSFSLIANSGESGFSSSLNMNDIWKLHHENGSSQVDLYANMSLEYGVVGQILDTGDGFSSPANCFTAYTISNNYIVGGGTSYQLTSTFNYTDPETHNIQLANIFTDITEGDTHIRFAIQYYSSLITLTDLFSVNASDGINEAQVYGPLKLAQYATGSLPTAANHEGCIVYDTTSNTVKFSNGTTWATI